MKCFVPSVLISVFENYIRLNGSQASQSWCLFILYIQYTMNVEKLSGSKCIKPYQMIIDDCDKSDTIAFKTIRP